MERIIFLPAWQYLHLCGSPLSCPSPRYYKHHIQSILSFNGIRSDLGQNLGPKQYFLGKKCNNAKGLCQKVWTQTKILSPNIRYFVAILTFFVIYSLFGNLWAKKVPFWVKNSIFWAKSALLRGTYCIFY